MGPDRLERAQRLEAFDPIDVPGFDEEQDADDQERHDGPCQLDLACCHTPALCVFRSRPETDERVDSNAGERQDDRGRDAEYHERQVTMANAGVDNGAKMLGV